MHTRFWKCGFLLDEDATDVGTLRASCGARVRPFDPPRCLSTPPTTRDGSGLPEKAEGRDGASEIVQHENMQLRLAQRRPRVARVLSYARIAVASPGVRALRRRKASPQPEENTI